VQSWLQVSQGLHTLNQVIVGAAVGSAFGALWFVLWHSLKRMQLSLDFFLKKIDRNSIIQQHFVLPLTSMSFVMAQG
jgi:hypothetical protein